MQVREILQQFAKKAQKQALVFYLCRLMAFYLPLSLLSFWLEPMAVAAIFCGLVLIHVAIWHRTHRGRFSVYSSAEFLNQQYPQLEHSCQLLLKSAESLNPLQQLQYAKTETVFHSVMENHGLALPQRAWADVVKLYGVMGVATGLVGLSVMFYPSNSLELSFDSFVPTAQQVQLNQLKVSVTPPAYSQLAAFEQQQGDIKILIGSEVKWQLEVKSEATPQLKINGELYVFEPTESGLWTLEQTIDQTSIYQIMANGEPLSDLFTIEVTQDQAPKVRVLLPEQRLVEIALNDKPVLEAKAMVSDDFGLSQVTLLTSVAKGSGEAVKFRDLNIEFDRVELQQDKNFYFKRWDLEALGMEPGDELYFTVVAYDNRSPKGQQGRSNTIIVRWQDEEVEGITGEGLRVSYELEYFRSQRQIIIETEQLIADSANMTQQSIDELSVSLGQSQSDLKQRYGQYLGDEFGEGPGDQIAHFGGHDDHEDEGGHSHKQENSHEEENSHSHDHGNEPGNDPRNDHSSDHGHDHANPSASTATGDANAVRNAFAHQHEAVHVGEVSSQNPKAMMKKAVGFMWQAELHLMLSQPQQALPYELQAYKYLKLAKQAERIYVKRLGFEPPPVSEENRLTGELKQVKSYHIQQQLFSASIDEDSTDREVFRHCFTVLNQHPIEQALARNQLLILNLCQQRLTALAQQRPSLIGFAAMVQQMEMAKKLQYPSCDDCVQQLEAKLWQLVDANDVGAFSREALYLPQGAP